MLWVTIESLYFGFFARRISSFCAACVREMIQCGKGLIHQKEGGAYAKARAIAVSLLHSARKLMGIGVLKAIQTNRFQQGLDFSCIIGVLFQSEK